jgi:hypothetical protein
MTRIVNTAYLASAIGRTPARVRQLRRAGVIPCLMGLNGRPLRNAFPLWQSVAEFARYKSESRYPGRPSVGEREDVDVQSVFEFI